MSIRSVLIIDDDPVFQEIVRDHFAQQGVTNIESAIDGKQAKQILQRMIKSPDAILCDLHMPEFNGIEFLQFLKHHACSSQLALVSGASDVLLSSAKILAEQYGLNFVGVFGKPLDFAAVDDALENHAVAA